VQFLAPSGKLGIFTEKACHGYHIVVVKAENFPGCITGKCGSISLKILQLKRKTQMEDRNGQVQRYFHKKH
jgi:hypothetical protein